MSALTEAVSVLVANDELHQVDSVLGRYLLKLPSWTAGQAVAAQRMLLKYSARLRGYGIRTGDLMDGMDRMDGTDRGAAAVPGKSVGVNCTSFLVRFPRDNDLFAAVQTLPGARWDGDGRAWRVPMTIPAAEQLFAFAGTYGFALAPEVFAKMDELTGAAQEAALASRAQDGEYLVPGLLKSLRPYQQAGVKYLVETAKGRALLCDEMGLGKTYEAIATAQAMGAWPLLVICPASLKYNWEREVRDLVGLKSLVVAGSKLGSPSTGSGHRVYTAPMTSEEKQEAHRWEIADRGGVTMFRVKKKGGKRGGGPEMEICRPTEFGQGYEPAKVMVVNYDLLRGDLFAALRRVKWGAIVFDESHYCKEATSGRTKAARALAQRVPVRLALSGSPVVNHVSDLLPQLSMIGRLNDLGGFWPFAERYCEAKKRLVRYPTRLSAVMDRDMDIDPVRTGKAARAIREECKVDIAKLAGELGVKPGAVAGLESGSGQWTGQAIGKFNAAMVKLGGKYIWDLTGRANAKELHERLRSTCFLRRLKKHVLQELPPKVRSTVPIELDNWPEYSAAEKDVVAFLSARAASETEFLATIAHLPEEARQAKIEERQRSKAEQLAETEMLVRFEALKQLSVKGKLAAAKEWIATFLDSGEKGEKLGVACEHVDIVKDLAAHFKAPCIYGDTPAKQRQAIVDRFQSDPTCKVIFCNTKAGGVGITLTAASNCAVLELPWTSAALDQWEDRFHRFGQRRSVTCYYLMGKNTVDWQIYGVIREKRQLTNAVVDGVEDEATGRARTLKELAREFLAPRFL